MANKPTPKQPGSAALMNKLRETVRSLTAHNVYMSALGRPDDGEHEGSIFHPTWAISLLEEENSQLIEFGIKPLTLEEVYEWREEEPFCSDGQGYGIRNCDCKDSHLIMLRNIRSSLS
jgi:hypothetical protein